MRKTVTWAGATIISVTTVLSTGHVSHGSSEPADHVVRPEFSQRLAGHDTNGSGALYAANGLPDSGARGSRVVVQAFSGDDGASPAVHRLAARGGRVVHTSQAPRSATLTQTISGAGPATPENRDQLSPSRLLAIPAGLDAAVAERMALADPTDADSPVTQPTNLIRLASFDPRPFDDAGSQPTVVSAMVPSAIAPLPGTRPTIDTQTEELTDEVLASVAMPEPRPVSPSSEGVEVASLEPQDIAPADVTATDALASLAVPLPQKRPAYAQPSPALAYARPSEPARPAERNEPAARDGIGGFFEKLFNGGSAQLPAARSGIAVYDINSATVYLPGDGRLEAHSGLGHMQDNARYVAQKNRGPTPPNIYNLVMRERRFHGAEAIRLLPSNGRKKYNRDGLLAHPYMYIGGGDRSQSNGCVVFKNYERFLKAFKQGRIKRMIVVPNLKELPTYMAAL